MFTATNAFCFHFVTLIRQTRHTHFFLNLSTVRGIPLFTNAFYTHSACLVDFEPRLYEISHELLRWEGRRGREVHVLFVGNKEVSFPRHTELGRARQ